MARAGLSGSEPGADLSAWLAKITARLSSSELSELFASLKLSTGRGETLCLPLHSDILTNFSGGYTFPSDVTKPKFRRVGHRSQGATN